MNSPKDLMIYGGTFAPPHNGHVHAVREYRRAFSPDLVRIMPAAIPPHKAIDADDSPQMRYRMTCLAFQDEAGYGDSLKVSDWELTQGGKSYTVHTLEHFASPELRLTLLCGTDMFLTLDTWHRAERIFELARIALMRREHDDALYTQIEDRIRCYQDRYGARIVQVPGDAVELSSTELRQMAARGYPLTGLVPEKVEEYIRLHGLYCKK